MHSGKNERRIYNRTIQVLKGKFSY
uniref:Uncharacterized protein n=1 Tax=Solanum lycopersicum TaxID=4081 RepID=K4C432_SOLLC